MTIHYCDRCKKEILETRIFSMMFSGNNYVELCKDCEAKFREWLCGTVSTSELPKKDDAE